MSNQQQHQTIIKIIYLQEQGIRAKLNAHDLLIH
uniref:Uncharacterized protein n=1 Tax=Arundo donax TaxID=35708 RepID=A0A0A8ZZA4_ARUDO